MIRDPFFLMALFDGESELAGKTHETEMTLYFYLWGPSTTPFWPEDNDNDVSAIPAILQNAGRR